MTGTSRSEDEMEDTIHTIRHVEEEAQKRDIVTIMSAITNDHPPISAVMQMLERALQAAYSRGYEAGMNA